MVKKGFTLIEVMIATVLFTVGTVAIIWALNAGIFASGDVENTASALNLAQAKMEELKGTSFAGITGQAKAAVTGFPAFSQEVTVTNVQTDLKQIVVTIYWTTKHAETDIALTTLAANG